MAPDFTKSYSKYYTPHTFIKYPDTGNPVMVEHKIFYSKDGSLAYDMASMRDPTQDVLEVWVGGISKNNQKIGSTGLFRDWVNGGDLTMPPYEYPSNLKLKLINKDIKDFFNMDVKFGNDKEYINANNFVSRIPVNVKYKNYLENKE